MADLERFRARILRPGLSVLAGLDGPRVSDAAERLLLSIACQESGCKHRYQVLSNGRAGPARGWWQFEHHGGVVGVMEHDASCALARRLCDHYLVHYESSAIWRALEGHDGLAAGFARLLLWTDPRPLPETSKAGWEYYLANWRPGKPHAATWPDYWLAANRVVATPETWSA